MALGRPRCTADTHDQALKSCNFWDERACRPAAAADGRRYCCQVVRFPYVANELYSMGQWARLARRRIEAYMRHLAGGSNNTEHRSMRWREVRRCAKTIGRVASDTVLCDIHGRVLAHAAAARASLLAAQSCRFQTPPA